MEPVRWYFDRSGHSQASFVQASCSNVNIEKQKVYGVDIGGNTVEIEYDYLIVAVGAEPATFGIPGMQ
jgi:NADH dehydrogenase FAD-containing subunit